MAHDLAAYVDAELGRAAEAMERLLRRAATRRIDTGVLAGLVTTCRYAGLFEESKAAHARAVMLDPARNTSVAWTHFMLADYDLAIKAETGIPPYCAILSKLLTGQMTAQVLRDEEAKTTAYGARLAVGAYRAIFEGAVDEGVAKLNELRDSGFADPEGWYIYALFIARAGAETHALDFLTRSVDGGYCSHAALIARPEWSLLAGRAEFAVLLERTARMLADARARFDRAHGAAVLTTRVSPSSKG
jgi:hypothetical protein